MNVLKSYPLWIMLFTLMACQKDPNALEIPSEYFSENFEVNAAVELAVGENLAKITNEAKKGRNPSLKVSIDSLNLIFNSGNPSLKSLNTSYFAGRLEGSGGWMDELAKASGNVYSPGSNITGNGGAFGGYLFDENGLELEQLLEKGQLGSVLYTHALTLLEGEITPVTVDRVIAIFGAHPTFPNTPSSSKTAFPDRFMANYAARRDKNDGNGLYTQLKSEFIRLKAAVEAGSDFNEDRDNAIRKIKSLWEKVNAATIINYCHTTIRTLSETNPTDAAIANALHAYAEGVGFIHGWRTIPSSDKIITDAEIDDILELFNAPYDGIPESYKFVTEPVTQLPRLTQIISKLQDIYQFSDQDIEDFKNNWVTVQGR